MKKLILKNLLTNFINAFKCKCCTCICTCNFIDNSIKLPGPWTTNLNSDKETIRVGDIVYVQYVRGEQQFSGFFKVLVATNFDYTINNGHEIVNSSYLFTWSLSELGYLNNNNFSGVNKFAAKTLGKIVWSTKKES